MITYLKALGIVLGIFGAGAIVFWAIWWLFMNFTWTFPLIVFGGWVFAIGLLTRIVAEELKRRNGKA